MYKESANSAESTVNLKKNREKSGLMSCSSNRDADPGDVIGFGSTLDPDPVEMYLDPRPWYLDGSGW